MAIELVTWVRVSADGPVPSCELKAVGDGLQDLMLAHVEDLRARARGGSAPPAAFQDDVDRSRFQALLSDSDEFLTVAQKLATELQTRMDGRTSPGLFVAMAGTDGTDVAAVFKLEVTSEFAGHLYETPTGEEVIAVIRNLLDTPGALQKGAVYPDPRADSDVVVGDKLADTSLYFLEAMGIRQIQGTKHAAVTLIRALAKEVPDRSDEFASAVHRSDATSVPELVDSLPDLDDEQRTAIVTSLQARKRPVRDLDPRRSKLLKKTVRASGITVSGHVSDFQDRVRIERRDDGGWRIVIEVDEPPTTEFEG